MSTSRVRSSGTFVAMALILTLVSACGATNNAIPTASPTARGTAAPTGTGPVVIKIGAALPSSGPDASKGVDAENGAQMAVDAANASTLLPGYRLAFNALNDAGANGSPDTTTGAANAKTLINDAQTAGILGPFDTTTAQAELPLTNAAPLVMLSPFATDPCLTQQDPAAGCSASLPGTVRPTGNVTFFRIVPTNSQQGIVMADYLFQQLHFKTVSVIDDTSPSGVALATGFMNEWQKQGGFVLEHRSEAPTSSYVSLLTQIAATKPDLIFYAGSDTTGGTLIRQQMQQVPSLQNTPFAGGEGIHTTSFATTIGLTGGPVYSTAIGVDVTALPSAASFVQQYQAKYGQPPSISSASGFDSTNLLIAAIKTAIAEGAKPPTTAGNTAAAKLFRQAVINAVAKTSYDGVAGHYSFNANGDPVSVSIPILQLAAVSGRPAWKQVNVQTLP